ncbi:unnamed protein product [Allacma fusca]|uniref:Uncharacterized protein n=1 Tax=Allacma fusca TaxID=39272 RepID=A0A8J2NZ35_9HEXA|nr:unnamed protein product [Allacma fusca]
MQLKYMALGFLTSVIPNTKEENHGNVTAHRGTRFRSPKRMERLKKIPHNQPLVKLTIVGAQLGFKAEAERFLAG